MSNTYGLDNKEIVYLYLQNKKLADFVNDLVQEGYEKGRLSFDLGDMVLSSDITSSELMEIMDIKKVKIAMSINDKLEPIVEMIKNTIPEVYEEAVAIMEEGSKIIAEEEDSEEDDEE